MGWDELVWLGTVTPTSCKLGLITDFTKRHGMVSRQKASMVLQLFFFCFFILFISLVVTACLEKPTSTTSNFPFLSYPWLTPSLSHQTKHRRIRRSYFLISLVATARLVKPLTIAASKQPHQDAIINIWSDELLPNFLMMNSSFLQHDHIVFVHNLVCAIFFDREHASYNVQHLHNVALRSFFISVTAVICLIVANNLFVIVVGVLQ